MCRHKQRFKYTRLGRTASNTVRVLAIRIYPAHVVSVISLHRSPGRPRSFQSRNPSSIPIRRCSRERRMTLLARKPDVIQQKKVMNAVWGVVPFASATATSPFDPPQLLVSSINCEACVPACSIPESGLSLKRSGWGSSCACRRS